MRNSEFKVAVNKGHLPIVNLVNLNTDPNIMLADSKFTLTFWGRAFTMRKGFAILKIF